jgi:hypothetical protein
MNKLVLMLAASLSTAAHAETRAPKGPLWVGDWCLVESIHSGRDPETNKPMPRLNKYKRPAPDCPTDATRFTFGLHSLDGLVFGVDFGTLEVAGWPKEIKKGKR